MGMFEDIPVDVGPIYEGERIRKEQMYVEFGGPNVKEKFELCLVKPPEEVEDGKVIIVGPDIKDLEEGKSYPFGIIVEVAGKELEKDLEGVFERRIHYFCNYIEGFMHLNQRYDIWLRLSRSSFKKGLNSFNYIGKVLIRLFKSEFPIIEKIQVTFITDPEKVKEWFDKALKIYEERDARALALHDEDVEEFYGCTLCQSFAPSHVCIITPDRLSLCGSISWLDARAAARIDPKGPNFRVEKGECLDPIRGEYSGANEAVREKSLGEVERVYLYSMFGYPHTTCGCCEAIAFYIPEVDGIGIVDRNFKGPTVIGLTFSALANEVGGGRQVEGFVGISIGYMRSPKFFQADGGWSRVVWMPSHIKERVKDAIPPELYDKIATEKDAMTIEELREFLKQKGHPVVERWAKMEEKAEEVPEEVEMVPAMVPVEGVPVAGGFRIIFKNVKITAEKMIIRRELPPKKKKE